MTLVILVADGVRPDTLFGAIDAGHLPALAALRRDGLSDTITSVFPSVTGPAYTPFLMGLHPGEAGVPGIRWWDRTGSRAYAHGNARSYTGFEALRQDGDLAVTHPTLFELAERPLAAFTPIGRGLRGGARLGAGIASWPRVAWHHFRGDVQGWLRLERELAARVCERVREGDRVRGGASLETARPDLVFLAHPGVDKLSHQLGQGAPEVLDALRVVDDTVARLRTEAERAARSIEFMIVSDHGHSAVHSHEDLAGTVAALGHGVLAHPWTFAGGSDVAVMVSGNAMAHLYLELDSRARPGWPALAPRWESLVRSLLTREAVDLLLLPHGPGECEVRARGRGRAMVRRDVRGRYRYDALDGDPLGLGSVLGGAGALEGLTPDDAHDATRGTAYPDALVQILALADAPRAGEIIVSAAPGWDLRARYEPVRHVSAHGSLHRDHMLVPIILSTAPATRLRRTTEVFALARRALDRLRVAG